MAAIWGVQASGREQTRQIDPEEAERRQGRGQRWASLMARTFGFDVLACPRCGGRLRLIALIEEAAVIERILRHLGVPTAIPAPRAARAPPFGVGAPDQAGWDAETSVFTPGSWRDPARRSARPRAGGVPAWRRCARSRRATRHPSPFAFDKPSARGIIGP